MIAMEISDLARMMNEGTQHRITQLTEEQEQQTVGDLEQLLIAVCILNHWIIREITDYYLHPGSRPGDGVRALRGHSPPISMEQTVEIFTRYGLDDVGKKVGRRTDEIISPPCPASGVVLCRDGSYNSGRRWRRALSGNRMAIRIISLWLLSFVAIPGQAGDAVRYLVDYIDINTVNPPCNEIHGTEFFARIFEREGIKYEIAESTPGRGNIWARLKGGDEPALLLLHHMDVVPASPETWNTDPLKAVVKDGKIIGRGTLDTKGLGIGQLQAFLALHRAGGPKKRDVIFMATADEEAGGRPAWCGLAHQTPPGDIRQRRVSSE
jgi:hypothetical protein